MCIEIRATKSLGFCLFVCFNPQVLGNAWVELLETYTKFSSISEYKIDLQEWIILVYSNSGQPESEIHKAVPLIDKKWNAMKEI